MTVLLVKARAIITVTLREEKVLGKVQKATGVVNLSFLECQKVVSFAVIRAVFALATIRQSDVHMPKQEASVTRAGTFVQCQDVMLLTQPLGVPSQGTDKCLCRRNQLMNFQRPSYRDWS